jgi:hypothetical protein
LILFTSRTIYTIILIIWKKTTTKKDLIILNNSIPLDNIVILNLKPILTSNFALSLFPNRKDPSVSVNPVTKLGSNLEPDFNTLVNLIDGFSNVLSKFLWVKLRLYWNYISFI